MSESSCYDVIILGAGLAGFRCGIELLKRHRNLRICILEKYDYVGGRVVTFHKDVEGIGEVQWEIGAGRISRAHTRVLGLMRKYGLHFSKTSAKTDFISEYDNILQDNTFSQLLDTYLKPLTGLSKDVLATHTLGELLEKIVGRVRAQIFYIEFPYYSEIHTLRADLAIESFKAEMHDYSGFGGCSEGLSAIIDAMNNEFQKLGGQLIKNMEVVSVEAYKGKTRVVCNVVEKACKTILHNKRVFVADVCIGALHSEAVRQIGGLKEARCLRHLKMEPLLRVYAVFKPGNNLWFSDLPMIITDSPLRFIIPVDYEKGVLMISYTDGVYVDKLLHEGGSDSEEFENYIMTEIRTLFPDRHIPDPVLFKKHSWKDGCTYLLHGKYDVEKESMASLHPLPSKLPGVFLCGESFAVKQCWMESALTQADLLLESAKFKRAIQTIIAFRKEL